jgi:hypothetical protein
MKNDDLAGVRVIDHQQFRCSQNTDQNSESHESHVQQIAHSSFKQISLQKTYEMRFIFQYPATDFDQ